MFVCALVKECIPNKKNAFFLLLLTILEQAVLDPKQKKLNNKIKNTHFPLSCKALVKELISNIGM